MNEEQRNTMVKLIQATIDQKFETAYLTHLLDANHEPVILAIVAEASCTRYDPNELTQEKTFSAHRREKFPTWVPDEHLRRLKCAYWLTACAIFGQKTWNNYNQNEFFDCSDYAIVLSPDELLIKYIKDGEIQEVKKLTKREFFLDEKKLKEKILEGMVERGIIAAVAVGGAFVFESDLADAYMITNCQRDNFPTSDIAWTMGAPSADPRFTWETGDFPNRRIAEDKYSDISYSVDIYLRKELSNE